MTTSAIRTTDASTDQIARTSPGPAQAFGLVLDAAVGTAAAKLERKVTGWLDRLDAVAESGGVLQAAGVEGIKARAHGRSPAWAAVRAVWQTGAPAVKAAVVTSVVAAVLLLLVSPALLVVYLLSWLVIAAVCRARAARQRRRTPA
ncbi:MULTISPECIES: hypothetical protein [unclassified Nocardioides]|uniref:hypothetical protein n=1 Tax=unclassified Nocardioides TaxID=2615069 RepID=UPI00360C4589